MLEELIYENETLYIMIQAYIIENARKNNEICIIQSEIEGVSYEPEYDFDAMDKLDYNISDDNSYRLLKDLYDETLITEDNPDFAWESEFEYYKLLNKLYYKELRDLIISNDYMDGMLQDLKKSKVKTL